MAWVLPRTAEPDGDVVGVSGRGAFADPSRVEAFAESLTERPQQVDLVLAVAPEGWSPTTYKEDRIVQFTGAVPRWETRAF